MGRWAQRRRNGGGPQTVKFIREANITGEDTAIFIWNLPVTGAEMETSGLNSTPSGAAMLSTLQVSANVVEVQFDSAIDTDTGYQWTSSTFGFVPVQTGLYNV